MKIYKDYATGKRIIDLTGDFQPEYSMEKDREIVSTGASSEEKETFPVYNSVLEVFMKKAGLL